MVVACWLDASSDGLLGCRLLQTTPTATHSIHHTCPSIHRSINRWRSTEAKSQPAKSDPERHLQRIPITARTSNLSHRSMAVGAVAIAGCSSVIAARSPAVAWEDEAVADACSVLCASSACVRVPYWLLLCCASSCCGRFASATGRLHVHPLCPSLTRLTLIASRIHTTAGLEPRRGKGWPAHCARSWVAAANCKKQGGRRKEGRGGGRAPLPSRWRLCSSSLGPWRCLTTRQRCCSRWVDAIMAVAIVLCVGGGRGGMGVHTCQMFTHARSIRRRRRCGCCMGATTTGRSSRRRSSECVCQIRGQSRSVARYEVGAWVR